MSKIFEVSVSIFKVVLVEVDDDKDVGYALECIER